MSGNITAFTGDIPRNYDAGLGPVLFVDYAADLARRAASAQPRRVLETAAGTGIVTQALHQALPPHAALTATDLNADMLAIARARLDGTARVAFQVADATDLPFPDAAFDTVVCQFGAMFYPDKARGYREAFRVLAPGGRYLFSVWDSLGHNRYAGIAHAAVARAFPADPPGFFAVPYAYNAIDPIKEALIEAGFRDITAHVLRIDKPVADLRGLATGIVFGSPLFGQIAARDAAAHPRVRDLIVEDLSREYGVEPVFALQAILLEARRLA